MKSWLNKVKGLKIFLTFGMFVMCLCLVIFFTKEKNHVEGSIPMQGMVLGADGSKEVKDSNVSSKMVTFTVENIGRSNPFLPPSEEYADLKQYEFELVAPPEVIASEESDAVKVVSTKVSGIMYDKKNPSAILNIEGEDYLVKIGDNINNYRILSIEKDVVTVQLGMNVHKARVGEIISGAAVNHNNVYDLQNKFGGAKK